jgi:hypothetical protein
MVVGVKRVSVGGYQDHSATSSSQEHVRFPARRCWWQHHHTRRWLALCVHVRVCLSVCYSKDATRVSTDSYLHQSVATV